MKVTPLAQGTGVPAATEGSSGQTATPTKLARAIAIAKGESVPKETGDLQANKVQASIKRIKMRTQVSTNRPEVIEEPVEDPNSPIIEQSSQEADRKSVV